MKNFIKLKSILSPMTTISTMVFFVFSSLMAEAKEIYTMTVVKSATVMKPDAAAAPQAALKCQTSESISKAVAKMGYESSNIKKPELIKKINQTTALFATRNADDGYLNSVTLYLVVKSQQGPKIFPLSEIDMERFELPKIQFDGQLLTVEADTLTIDPKEENDFFKIPSIQGHVYQNIRPGAITTEGLNLNILNCTR